MSEFDNAVLKIKSWWKSATVWLGGLVVVLANSGDLLQLLGMDVHPVIRQVVGTVVGLAIVYNRLFGTRQAITTTAAMKPVTADKIVRQ